MNTNERFETIYHATFTSLSKYLLMKTGHVQDAQDLVQDLYYDFYAYLVRTEVTIENPQAYLKTMANHLLARYYAEHDRVTTLKTESNDPFETLQDPLDLEISVLDKIEVEDIWTLVDSMEEPVKTFILLRFRFNMNYREISEGMNIPETTIKSALYKALKKIKDMYEKGSSNTRDSSSI